ncbi:MAG: hypothetical protein ABIL68_09405 [bacterium]
MKRREFIQKTSGGLTAVFTSRLGLASVQKMKHRAYPHAPTQSNYILDLKTIRKNFPPLKKWTYLDTAFIGLMSSQVKAAHE